MRAHASIPHTPSHRLSSATLAITPHPLAACSSRLLDRATAAGLEEVLAQAEGEISRLRQGAADAEEAVRRAEIAAAALATAESERDKMKGIARELRRQKDEAKAAREEMEARLQGLEKRLSEG